MESSYKLFAPYGLSIFFFWGIKEIHVSGFSYKKSEHQQVRLLRSV
jgi:hypothetical protein